MSSLREHFNAGDETALRGLVGPASHLHYADYILRQIDAPEGARVLDLGCGDGAVLAAVQQLRPDLQCVGVDFAESQVERARVKHGHLPQIEFAVRDLQRDVMELGAFDRLYSFSVAQYFPPVELADACRRLRPSLGEGARIVHLSIPDLSKRAIMFQDSFLNERPSGSIATWLHLQKMLLVDFKRRAVGDRRYGSDSLYHDAEELARLCRGEFATRVVRPSDSWYRFDLHLAAR